MRIGRIIIFVPGAAQRGRVLGLDRAPEVKTIRGKLARAGQAAKLIMTLARQLAGRRAGNRDRIHRASVRTAS